jgi:hypothetical protein
MRVPRIAALLFGAVVSLLAACSAQATNFDFNSNNGGFTSTSPTGAFDGPWVYGAASGVAGSGGWSSDGQNPENNHANTTELTSPPLVVAAAGNVLLSFAHRYSFEFDGTRWDGGAVFMSVNNGAFTQVPGASFTANGYNSTVDGGSNSQLAGQAAFTEASPGYANGTFITSSASLGTFAAGNTIRLTFRAAYDTNTSAGVPDWVVDNINVSNIVPEPSSLLLLVFAGPALFLLNRRRRAA